MPKSSAYDPRAIQALRQYAPASGDPLAFIATALIESGLRPNATGDSGHSFGLFQLNDRGRLASAKLTPQQAFDPAVNARVSAAEFARYAAKGLKGAQLALAAQRPSDPAYAQKFAAALPQAQAILGGFGGSDTASVPPNLPQTLGGTGLDAKRLMMLLRNQRGRSLRGIMPAQNFRKELMKLVQGASAGSAVGAAQQNLGQALAPIASDLKLGGGPGVGTHSFTERGSMWQDDMAYDLMGKPGEAFRFPFAGTISRISGQPGGDPRFAGYGITVDVPGGGSYFIKHLGALGPGVKVGAKVSPNEVLGTLDPTVQGGAHAHTAATSRALLDNLVRALGLKR